MELLLHQPLYVYWAVAAVALFIAFVIWSDDEQSHENKKPDSLETFYKKQIAEQEERIRKIREDIGWQTGWLPEDEEEEEKK